MKYGFIKVAAAVPAVKVGDVVYNVQQIESLIAQAEGKGVEVMIDDTSRMETLMKKLRTVKGVKQVERI